MHAFTSYFHFSRDIQKGALNDRQLLQKLTIVIFFQRVMKNGVNRGVKKLDLRNGKLIYVCILSCK